MITSAEDGSLDNWDIVIASGAGIKELTLGGYQIRTVQRSFAIRNDVGAFQMSGSKSRLGNRSYAKGGLTKNIADKIAQSKSLYEQGKSRTEQVLAFIKNENLHFGDVTNWIKQSYQEKNTIITNSKTNKTKKEKTDEETEKLLNSLEDKNNHIRAIFTVDRLTEGWDVLNLFDIVRLYSGQNTGGSTKKTPEATTKEKQLI